MIKRLSHLWNLSLVGILSLGLNFSSHAEDTFDLFEDPAKEIQKKITDQIQTSLSSVTTSKQLSRFQGRRINDVKVKFLSKIKVKEIKQMVP